MSDTTDTLGRLLETERRIDRVFAALSDLLHEVDALSSEQAKLKARVNELAGRIKENE